MSIMERYLERLDAIPGISLEALGFVFIYREFVDAGGYDIADEAELERWHVAVMDALNAATPAEQELLKDV